MTTTVYPAAVVTPTSSSYLGGTNHDIGMGVSVDNQDCLYVLGITSSSDFPTTGAYQSSLIRSENQDVFISKIGSTGSTIVYSTYIGGSLADQGFDIEVDTDGCAYITGRTKSTNFPTIAAYQSTLSGNYDGFVVKLATAGSSLTFSTYLGGESKDIPTGIALDDDEGVYITGITESFDFPTSGSYQSIIGGMTDIFFTKFTATGASLTYSTFIGGNSDDAAYGIDVVSESGYIVGSTKSSNFPTVSSYQSTKSSTSTEYDALVIKVASAGSSLTYSTYLGGSSSDSARGVSVGTDSFAYVTGYTTSSNFPTSGGYQDSLSGTYDAFITKVAVAGSTLTYSTYLGGTGNEISYGIDIDTTKRVYITGSTTSSNFPTTESYQSSLGGTTDAFVSIFNSDGDSILQSTYLGGSGIDASMAIKIDSDGDAFITGKTMSADFPTVASYQDSIGSSKAWDAFYTILE